MRSGVRATVSVDGVSFTGFTRARNLSSAASSIADSMTRPSELA